LLEVRKVVSGSAYLRRSEFSTYEAKTFDEVSRMPSRENLAGISEPQVTDLEQKGP